MPLIRMAYDAFKDVEKRMKYRFWDKERERSERSYGLADRGPIAPSCPLGHQSFAWSGPPYNKERLYVCITCGAYCSEDMIKDMGYLFDTVPDYIIYDLMNEVARQKYMKGDPIFFGGLGGR